MLTRQQIIAELNDDNKIDVETNDTTNNENFDDKVATLSNTLNNFTEKFTEAVDKLHEKYFTSEKNIVDEGAQENNES